MSQQNQQIPLQQPNPVVPSAPQMPPVQPPVYAQPVAQYVPVPAPVRPAPPIFDQRDRIFSVVFLVLSVLSVNLSVFGGFLLGFTVSALMMLLAIFFYQLRPGMKITPFSVICLLSAAGFCIPFALYDSVFSRFWLFCAFVLYLVTAYTQMTGSARWSFNTFRGVGTVFNACLMDPWEHLPTAFHSFAASHKEDSKRSKNKGVWLGALCALPVLGLVLPLLIASDAAYEALFTHLLEFTPADLFGSLILGALLFFPLFSTVFAQRKRSIAAAACKSNAVSGKISPASVIGFLAVISFVYLTYLLVQPVYFVGAFRDILPENYTMAQYARRGFFELTAICAINLVILFVCLLTVRRQGNQPPVWVSRFAGFICVFSMALSVCSIAKMFMYISRFGMTRMRIATSVFMLLLFAVFMSILLRLFLKRFAYMKMILILTAVIGLTVGFADIDTVIARYNTQAYLSGTLESIDVSYLNQLSSAAVPCLVELSECEDQTVAQQAETCLMQRVPVIWLSQDGQIEYKNPNGSFRSYNYSQQKALQLLAEYLEQTKE